LSIGAAASARQTPLPSPADEQTPTTPTLAAQPTPIPIPPERAHPRATVRTFLEAMRRWKDADPPSPDAAAVAVECLDMADYADIPRVAREEAGRALATDLRFVINRVAAIELDQIPDDPSGAAYVWHEEAAGAIELTRTAVGDWKFSPRTVASIEELALAYRGERAVSGVTEGSLTISQRVRGAAPAFLLEKLLGLFWWQWIALVVVACIGVIVDRAVAFALRAQLSRRLDRWLAGVDPQSIAKAMRPIGLLAMTMVWRSGARLLELPPRANAILIVAVTVVTVFAAVMGAYRLVDVISAALEIRAKRSKSRFDDLLVPLFRKSFKVVITVFSLVFVAETFEWEQYKTLLAGLGIGGLAFALAAQDTVSNLFGSFTVILDRPFEVGDWVAIANVEGTVETVGFRSTRIRTFYNSLITLPNSTLIKASVDNFGKRRYRRWKTNLSIAYDTPPERIEAFCEGIRELVRRHPFTRKDYYHVYLNAFGPASLDILVYVFHEVPDWGVELQERHRLALDTIRLAERLGVEFAYPTQTLYLKRGAAIEPRPDGKPSAREVEESLAVGRRQAQAIVEGLLGRDGKGPSGAASSTVPETENRGESADTD
jgi:MscS family membrane protein